MRMAMSTIDGRAFGLQATKPFARRRQLFTKSAGEDFSQILQERSLDGALFACIVGFSSYFLGFLVRVLLNLQSFSSSLFTFAATLTYVFLEGDSFSVVLHRKQKSSTARERTHGGTNSNCRKRNETQKIVGHKKLDDQAVSNTHLSHGCVMGRITDSDGRTKRKGGNGGREEQKNTLEI
jgi:hypothetical protein